MSGGYVVYARTVLEEGDEYESAEAKLKSLLPELVLPNGDWCHNAVYLGNILLSEAVYDGDTEITPAVYDEGFHVNALFLNQEDTYPFEDSREGILGCSYRPRSNTDADPIVLFGDPPDAPKFTFHGYK